VERLRDEQAVALFDFLSGKPARSAEAETEAVRTIVAALDRLEPDRARYLAAFAYILSRAARADLKVSARETEAMERALIHHGSLSTEQAILVIQIAKYQNLLFGATENFLVTREFNRIASREQKLELLDCLFAVAAEENLISIPEDEEIRRIARELGLEHHEFIEIRSRYRDRLSYLKENQL
jgi:uncharacterized tellurite resistance protein B-like protein